MVPFPLAFKQQQRLSEIADDVICVLIADR